MNIPERFWKVATVFVIILSAAAVIGAVKLIKSIGYVGVNPNMTNTITVDGSGDAVAIPDVATFSFGVTVTAKTVADAQSQATAKINSALKAVKDSGVADKDITTLSYNINPHYEYRTAVCPANASGTPVYCPGGKQILTGYEVSETVQVKVRDTAKAGDIFSTIGSQGVDNVNGLQFSVDNPDSVQAEARAKAIAKAQSKADDLAKKLGVSLVRITGFYESNGPVPYAYGMGGGAKTMMAADVASVPSPDVPVGQQKVTDNVSITYEIK